MSPGKNRHIHGLLNELHIMDQKAVLVDSITHGRTDSSSEMSELEANLFIRKLQEIKEDKVKAMRGKIVYYLCLYGMTNNTGRPDYDRINKFIRNIGKNNPKQKLLFNLSPKEMRNCLNQVEAMYKKELRKS